MDVSAIGTFNPNSINWRNLTAKEILKYKKQGVEVPNIYIQWANEFLRNVEKYDNDEITYENAKAAERHSSPSDKDSNGLIAQPDSQTSGTEVSADTAVTSTGTTQTDITATTQSANSTSDTNNTDEEPQMTAAQAKRQEMTDNNVSLRNQAISFTQDSSKTASNAKAQEVAMNAIKASSENEIQTLESEMKSILSEAESKQSELRQEVANINHDHSSSSTFAKIEQLQKELEQYGQSAQSQTAQTENILNGHGTDIESATTVFSSAGDFGAETISVGNDLLSQSRGSFMEVFFNIPIARNAIATGQTSVNNGQSGESAQSDARSTNTNSLSQVNSIKNEIQEKTGVKAQSRKEQGSASNQDPITGKEHESTKDVKASQNDGTDTTDKLNISLDELVKRKVRRGEYTKEA
ncbi:MAG TPA: hypothetical protein DEO94_06900 [Cyanobacteria bacterium UBA11991]|nr:hypothetical protein [Cyanobacteriota bacterium]HCB11836.1 hypothetical protein [Cyanobacteria bacterium UBA11991]